MGTGNYTTKGLYNKYDKNHSERDKLDYYATPTNETLNGLQTINIQFADSDTILEPSCGGGHMVAGILQYLSETNSKANLIATDIHAHQTIFDFPHSTGEEYDFLSDDYPCGENIDWIIMNPPYATIEPFTIRALEIAKKGVIMLGRLQFLEGAGRYETILSEDPPTDVYIYVDRIQCWKGGIKPTGSSAQAYAWFVWDRTRDEAAQPQIHWIRRAN